MARNAVNLPDAGDPFPRMRMELTDGASVALPEFFADAWGVMLFYRGAW